MERIGIIGAGAWGTALAATLRRAGREVVLWAREPEIVESIRLQQHNALFLPEIALDGVIATGDVAEAVAADAVMLVVPAQFLRATCRSVRSHWRPGTAAVICAKGIESETGATMSEIASEELPGVSLAILSGPTFAVEVAKGLPTAVTLACGDTALGQRLIAAIGTARFRPYVTDDVVGVEIGGAVKNVLAIGCGVAEGAGFGDNARAALITRGLAEMVRLAVARGGRPETCMGLAGLGDLILTASSTQSRNYSLGFALGEGQHLGDILAARRSVTEGVAGAASVMALAERLGVDMPICATVQGLLHQGLGIKDAIGGLLARPFAAELGFNPAEHLA